MRRWLLMMVLLGMAGCAANAKLASKGETIFRLHDQHVVERDLTLPQTSF